MDAEIYDIHKAGGVLIKGRKLLVVSKDSQRFMAPGGKLEANETATQALVRELMEELGLKVNENQLKPFGTFYAQAFDDDSRRLRMDVFVITGWQGKLTLNPNDTVRAFRWINSTDASSIKLGSIFAHDVLPRLKAQDLID